MQKARKLKPDVEYSSSLKLRSSFTVLILPLLPMKADAFRIYKRPRVKVVVDSRT